jgi:hypothetical protein
MWVRLRADPWRLAILAVLLGSLNSCAHTPPDAVRLSETMGRDLADVHRAHRELVRSYFGRLEGDADAFVDEVYRPYIVGRAIEDTGLLAELDRARKPGSAMDPLDVLQVFVEETTARIDSFRLELRSPLESQERALLADVDAAHDQLYQANTVLTAHLRSLRRVEAEQDTLFAGVGLGADLRSRLTDGLVRVSSQVERILGKARTASAALDSLPDQLRQALGQ